MFTNIIIFTAMIAFLPKIFGLLRNLSNNVFNVANEGINSWFKKPEQKNPNPFDPNK